VQKAFRAAKEATERPELFAGVAATSTSHDGMYAAAGGSEMEHQSLIEKSNTKLLDARRSLAMTEQMGAGTLSDLSDQRSRLEGMGTKLRQIDDNLNISSRILRRMHLRSWRNKAVLFFVILMLLGPWSLAHLWQPQVCTLVWSARSPIASQSSRPRLTCAHHT
jgi:hypothetical protein